MSLQREIKMLQHENRILAERVREKDEEILREFIGKEGEDEISPKIKNVVDNMGGERVGWNDYFMSMAHLASSRSPCERLHVGCVLVKDNRLVSMGYNGFLKGLPHVSIMEDEHEQATVHAEQNAVTDAARRGVSVEGTTAYITHYPCINCAKILMSSGIKRIYYHSYYKNNPIVEMLNPNVLITKT